MSSFVPFSNPGTTVTVTKEEYLRFYLIDRQLFTRLVVGLGRDTSQSMHTMAFIMWLDKQCKDMKMLKNMLRWPDTMLNNLADEAILVLNCIESSQFLYDDAVNDKALPLIKTILQNNAASLKYFYTKRVFIIAGVTKLLNNVCVRAFKDIVQQVQYMNVLREHNLRLANTYGASPYANQVVYYTPPPIVPQPIAIPTPQRGEGSSSSSSGANPPIETYDISNQIAFSPNLNELLAMLNKSSISTINTTGYSDEKKVVSIDDRIIFMTFSKGYPISKAEVRDFFSRRYGDIIEALHMQDVALPEQPLYARIVVRAESIHIFDNFFDRTNKVKLSINGKHAWARKYLSKGNKSPKAKSPVTSQAPSLSSARPYY